MLGSLLLIFMRFTTGSLLHMHSSVENIPVELLIDILLESGIPRTNKDKNPFEDVIEECQRPVTNWVPLMQVCRHFHDVILGTPRFWSRIPVANNLAALQQRLYRSRNSSLDLLFDGPCGPALPLILPLASRIRAIITTPRFHINSLPSLVPLLNDLLPSLEHVHIVPRMSFDYYSTDWHKLRDSGFVLNESLHPRVKTVASPRLLLPLKESGFWYEKLFHLDIRSQYGRMNVERQDDIFSVLKSTPLLESLAITFHDFAPPPQFFGNTQTPPTNLPREPTLFPRLLIVKLSGPAWLCGPLLHGIDAPTLERLYIRTTSHPNGTAMRSLADMFPARLRLTLAQHRRLHIHAGDHGFRLGDCHCEAGRVSSDRLYLRVYRELDDHRLPLHILCRVFKDACLETLEVNYFTSQPPETCGGWGEVLRTFPDLRKVTLYKNDQKSGTAMLAAIEALQKVGLNPDMKVVAENASW